MCIIVAKKFDSKYPTKETLKKCFNNNNDGAGFSYVKKGDRKVTIKKGFMSFDDFITEYERIIKNMVYSDIQILYHFRITTSGGTSQSNCHPFPISDNKKQLTSLFIKCPVAVAMNGIIDVPASDKTLSDTMEFIKRDMFLHSKLNKSFYRNNIIYADYLSEVGAKWAFMDTQNIYLFGEFIKDKGLYFSNSSYKNSRYYYYNYGAWDNWEDYGNITDYKSKNYGKYDNNLLDKTKKLCDSLIKANELVEFEGFAKDDNNNYSYIGMGENVYMSFGEELYLFENGKYYYLPELMVDYSM